MTESMLLSIFGFIGAIIVMFVLRGFFLWYWGVKDIIKNQRELIDILKPKTPPVIEPISWVCPNCKNENSTHDFYCKKCKLEKP